MFRISLNGHEPIVNVDQVEAIEPAIRRAIRGVTSSTSYPSSRSRLATLAAAGASRSRRAMERS